MKGLTKTIVAIALVTTLIATMGMSAMAAATYTTKTTYQADGKISVEANASGLEAGDIVTYVATTDATDVNENTIVYINQAEVETGKTSVKFNYSTEITNINASMFFGGSTENERKGATAEGYELNVAIAGKDTVKVIVPEQNTEDEIIRKIELGSDLLAGMKVKSLEIGDIVIHDGFAADADTIIVKTNAINKDDLTLTVNAVKAEDMRVSIGKGTTKDENNITAYAKAINGDSFGVVIYAKDVDVNKLTYGSEVVADAEKKYVILPALGKNADGVYGVELQGYSEWISDPAFVKAYAVSGDTFNLSGATAVFDAN